MKLLLVGSSKLLYSKYVIGFRLQEYAKPGKYRTNFAILFQRDGSLLRAARTKQSLSLLLLGIAPWFAFMISPGLGCRAMASLHTHFASALSRVKCSQKVDDDEAHVPESVVCSLEPVVVWLTTKQDLKEKSFFTRLCGNQTIV